MDTVKQTDQTTSTTAAAMIYTFRDFKVSLVVVSVLANLTIFVSWMAFSLA